MKQLTCTVAVSIRIPEELEKEVTKYKQRTGISKVRIYADALREFLEKRREK